MAWDGDCRHRDGRSASTRPASVFVTLYAFRSGERLEKVEDEREEARKMIEAGRVERERVEEGNELRARMRQHSQE